MRNSGTCQLTKCELIYYIAAKFKGRGYKNLKKREEGTTPWEWREISTKIATSCEFRKLQRYNRSFQVSERTGGDSIWRPLGPSFTDAHKFSRSLIFGDCRPILKTFGDLSSLSRTIWGRSLHISIWTTSNAVRYTYFTTLEGNLLTRFLESLTLTTRPLQPEPLWTPSSFQGEMDLRSYTET